MSQWFFGGFVVVKIEGDDDDYDNDDNDDNDDRNNQKKGTMKMK